MKTGLVLSELYSTLLKKNQFNKILHLSQYKHATQFSTKANDSSSVSVADFYSGKSVFITGGTGFIGMALIEKLLYRCTNIKNIYLLIRDDEQLNASERLQKMLENPAFSRLRKERLTDLEKLVPIAGNIGSPNLGIAIKDEAVLIEKVSVVFHSAAITIFNSPLKEAMKVNYEGTKKVISLCKKIKNIHAFVYISTAYSNTDRKIIEEIVYPPPGNINDIYRHLERCGDDKKSVAIKKILGDKPNTYAFTKALTENLVNEESKNVPSIIIRPTMVGPAMDEPVEGWLCNFSAPSTLLLAGGSGFNHVIRGSKTNIVDFVPVDYVVNLVIVAPTVWRCLNKLAIYNCGTGSVNPIQLGEVFEFFNKSQLKFTRDDLPLPKVFIVKHRWSGALLTFLTQIIPAFCLDIWNLFKGKMPRYVERQKKLIKMRDSIEYFTLNSWSIKTNRLEELNKSMTHHDQQSFSFNISDINWPQYMTTYANAVKSLASKTKRQV